MSATVIRAGEESLGVQHPAFNFEDLRGQADRYLQEVRTQAAKIIADAQKEVARRRQEAETEALASATRRVEEMVQQRLAAQLGKLSATVRHIADEIGQQRQAWQAHWEKAAVHLAAAIAARIIRRPLAQEPQITLTLLREALELAAGSAEIRVRLAPADREQLRAPLQEVLAELRGVGTAEIIADASIAPGGCRVETRFGVIDQQITAQLARIEEELT